MTIEEIFSAYFLVTLWAFELVRCSPAFFLLTMVVFQMTFQPRASLWITWIMVVERASEVNHETFTLPLEISGCNGLWDIWLCVCREQQPRVSWDKKNSRSARHTPCRNSSPFDWSAPLSYGLAFPSLNYTQSYKICKRVHSCDVLQCVKPWRIPCK